MKRIFILFPSVLIMLFAHSASAADLIEAWRAAQENDFEYSASRAAHQAGEARRAQSSSLWRPSVVFTGTVGRSSNETSMSGVQFSAPGFGQSNGVAFNTSVNNGTAERWTVSARQPLISGERQAQGRQLALAADAADLEWQGAKQALMLRVSERYFDAALASESLRVLRRQQAAVDRALTEVRERFRIGDVKVTDTHEAAAQAEAIKARVLAAEADLQLKQVALSDVTGLPPGAQTLFHPAQDAAPFDASSLDRWLAKAKDQNILLQMQMVSTEIAKEEAAKFRAVASSSLDLVAQAGRDRLTGNGDFGAASNTASNKMIGIQLTVPLFTGGYRSARQDEALRLADKARADAGRMRQQIAQQTRAAWLGLTVGASRVAALADAWKASLARLDATRIGNEVGDRTTLDLLNAESDAANAELALLQARIGLVLDRLRLAALAGELDEAQLRSVNATLQAGNSTDVR